MGSTCNSDGGWFNEQVASNNYFLGTYSNQPELYIYVAVVDQVGTFIYWIPFAQSNEIWPVLSRKMAACTLGARPNNSGPPCSDSTPYCALFFYQTVRQIHAKAGQQGGSNQGCKVNAQQGRCENWWRLFENTRQWLWPANGRQSVVQYQAPAPAVELPRNYEMEALKVDWLGNAQFSTGCCVQN